MAHPAILDIVTAHRFLERKTSNLRADFVRGLRSVETVAVQFETLLERHVLLCWIEFTVVYLVWAMLNSHRKQLWFDELVSYSVDHLPSWSASWHALSTGVDANPPLFHFINRLLLSVFGDTPDIQRLSSILGFWALGLCLFLIMRRNHSVAASWVAALVPACSGAAYYATESRPYGLVLGFVSFAVICWLNAIESRDKAESLRWRIGLTLSLACAISCHYYAVFAIAPFLGAELLRAARRFQFDWGMVAAIVASYFPLPFYSELMTAANQYTGNSNAIASFNSPVEFWTLILGPVILSLAMAVSVAFAWRWLTGTKPRLLTLSTDSDTLIGAMFCAMPIVVAIGARFITHEYENRYALTAIIGAAILIGAGFEALRRAIPGAAGLAIVSLLLPVAGEQILSRNKPRGRHVSYAWNEAVNARPELPVVYGSPLEFVQTYYNAPGTKLKKRLTVLLDAKEAQKRLGSTTADLGVQNLSPALRMPISNYGEFTTKRQPFYFVHQPAFVSWVLPKLIEDGAKPELQGVFGDVQVYMVTWPQIQPPAKVGNVQRASR